jgi:hypothetical protein
MEREYEDVNTRFVHNSSGIHEVLKALSLVIQGRELEGVHHLHLVLRIKMSEAIRSLPRMSSWLAVRQFHSTRYT